MKKLRISLVGAGRRAQSHLPVITAMKDVYQLVAVCDTDREAAKSSAQSYGAAAYTDMEEMVKREDLDVVDLTTPRDSHHIFVSFLAEKGINVIVETPIAETLPLADLMIHAAEKAGVKLEVAENYYRAPVERFRRKLLDAGVIGETIRVYRIFQEVGNHGMSWVRVMAGGSPKTVTSMTKTSPIVPITDRKLRHHTHEQWTMGIIDFNNEVTAITMYSNVIHARSLGRRTISFNQIDGSKGTIVNEEVHVVKEEDLETGGNSTVHPMRRITVGSGSMKTLERVEADTTPKVVWKNPFAKYPLHENRVAVADELWSIAKAVLEDTEPEYGPAEARRDLEMFTALEESGNQGRKPISLPIKGTTKYEEWLHRAFEEKYGISPFKVNELLDVHYLRK